jgi:hypothetical protein
MEKKIISINLQSSVPRVLQTYRTRQWQEGCSYSDAIVGPELRVKGSGLTLKGQQSNGVQFWEALVSSPLFIVHFNPFCSLLD